MLPWSDAQPKTRHKIVIIADMIKKQSLQQYLFEKAVSKPDLNQ